MKSTSPPRSRKSTPQSAKAKPAGHSAHTRDAADEALRGSFSRRIKITFFGAGSGFTPRLLNDVLRIPGMAGGTIALVDIDANRLSTMTKLIRKLVRQLDKTDWSVIGSTNRVEVMAGSDYLVNCIEVSGIECVKFDNDIPLKYAVDQCIGDTIGPGGLFKALRTIPVFLEVLKDAERLCPQAIVLNYTNPMNMMCLAAARTSPMSVVGLCHSVQGTSNLLADYAGVPYPELDWECAGINHLAWFTKLRHHGKDLYPDLITKFATEIADGYREARNGLVCADAQEPQHVKDEATKTRDLIRKDMCIHFGAFITESSGHLSEYLPYYRKSDAGRGLLRRGYDGGSRFYATNWPDWRKAADKSRADLLKGAEPMDWKRSWEYASWIIEAREKNVPFRIHGNVMNQIAGGGSLITNLPANGCVEVACLVDGNGIQPTRYGALPPQMAALCASNMAMFDLAAIAAVDRSKEAAIHAMMLDPLTAAICTPSEIKAMTLEMFQAEKAYLKGYR
jgi:alpha-galactosidase